MPNVNYYTERAYHLLVNDRTDCRAFDDCFENFCGEEVVRNLMSQAESDPELAEAIRNHGFWESWNELVNRYHTDFQLV